MNHENCVKQHKAWIKIAIEWITARIITTLGDTQLKEK